MTARSAALTKLGRSGDWKLRRPPRCVIPVDFVFRRERVAVFVDGSFCHACPRHGTMAAGNRAFWKAELGRNTVRDALVTRALRKAGWAVLRIWEHDLAEKHWPRVVRRLSRADGSECQAVTFSHRKAKHGDDVRHCLGHHRAVADFLRH